MLNQKIENLLKSNKKYISETKEILKTKVYEDAVNINKELIELLLSDKKVKKTYFTEINGILVFDKQGFLNFLESKDFLPDSYTAFKNKIGLTDRNGNYLSDNDDVVLSFPYKDCVLVGGQDKDDQKREEKMYNEILASEEISTLFSPKVLTNIKRFGKISSQSVSQSDVLFSENDNLIIKGNNLIALASLLKRYEGKVKCIYIDPPYNTGDDSFNYNDRFNHSTWLTFMKNRLDLAKRLLSDDGVIYIQINDVEAAYLKNLCDEIFNRSNYETTFYVKVRHENRILREDSKYQLCMEQVLVYKRSDKYITPRREKEDKSNSDYIYDIEIIDKFKDKVKIGKYDIEIYDKKSYRIKESSNGKLKRYSIRGSLITQKGSASEFYEYNLKSRRKLDGLGTLYKVIGMGINGDGLGFRYIKQPDDEKTKNGIYFQGKPLREKNNKGLPIPNFYDKVKCFNNTGYEGVGYFNGGKKPEEWVQYLINISTQPNDLVLDFHLGSGTTAAVAHKMGRRYIGIEQMDYIEDMVVERLKKVIDGEQSGISKAINWQGGGSFVYCELKENGQKLIDSVLSSDGESIDKIKEKIFSDDRIVPYITKQELEKVDKDFLNLKLEEKKKVLIDLVDKNKLYINYSDIDNEEYDISKEEKQFNNSFYKDVK